MSSLSHRLQAIAAAADHAGIAKMTRGLEKESLRVSEEGKIAQTGHPVALGSTLTHPQITTDYSEALVEFITDATTDLEQPLKELTDLHRVTYANVGSETLWVNSMPCQLSEDKDIPIARYGSSNSGVMKSVYRLGLGHRYGRAMQTIAGIHFNFSVSDDLWAFLHNQDQSSLSLQDYKTEGYFSLIRNFRRNFWLLLYLFGAAPAICKSFIKNRPHQLVPVGEDQHSLHAPFGTSLRMGDLGYQSSAQESLIVTYNCLKSYAQTLCRAITKTHPEYQAIGIKDEQGHYKQLNDSLLQIENEFYSVIRPKRTSRSGQTALEALVNGGVEYIEVRCLDLNPFEPVGISANQMRFLDLFLLFCLLEDSPLSDEKEYRQLQENQRRMVYEGRKPDLKLWQEGTEVSARDWGQTICDKLEPIAKLLDNEGSAYQTALANERQKLVDDSLTPAAKIIAELKEKKQTFFRWAMDKGLENREHFLNQPLTDQERLHFEEIAKESLAKQVAMEAASTQSFDEFVEAYYAQYDYCSECTSR